MSERWYSRNGKKYVSATTVLPFDLPDSAVLRYGQQRGKAVHKVTALHDNDNLKLSSIDPITEPYLEGWIKFKEECQYEPVLIEKAAYSDLYQYACTPDRVGYMSYLPTIAELKTGDPHKPCTWGLQTAAQEQAIKEEDFPETTFKRVTVQLTDEGDYKILEWKAEDDLLNFLAHLKTFQWRRANQ